MTHTEIPAIGGLVAEVLESIALNTFLLSAVLFHSETELEEASYVCQRERNRQMILTGIEIWSFIQDFSSFQDVAIPYSGLRIPEVLIIKDFQKLWLYSRVVKETQREGCQKSIRAELKGSSLKVLPAAQISNSFKMSSIPDKGK